jgi:hypothetical protein
MTDVRTSEVGAKLAPVSAGPWSFVVQWMDTFNKNFSCEKTKLGT